MAEKNVKAKNDKPGFFKRLGQKFKNLKSEMKKITWASKKSTFKNFGVVVGAIIALAVVIGLVDFGLTALINWLADVIPDIN
ncbi:MAG: preprotein translocase subunit SecE [Clostridia bacterium]|nr:preprotein translocase subunit SecE [Clostridia bacterium]